MPTVIRSTITRTVRAQTDWRGLSERRRSLPQTRRSSGRRERRAAERRSGREPQSQCEGAREQARRRIFTGGAHFGAEPRGCASLFFMRHFTHASLSQEVPRLDFAQDRTFNQENICFQITRKCENLKREPDPNIWECFVTDGST